MTNIVANESKIILKKDNNIDEILIDFNDYKSNCSKLRMQVTNLNTFNSNSIYDKYKNIIENINVERLSKSTLFIVTILFNKLIKKSTSVKMIEIGSGDGRLSKYFAEILKYFDEKNELICLDTFNERIEVDSFFEEKDTFQLYKSNINSSNASNIVKTIVSNPIDILEILEDDSFDIVFINNKFSDDVYINQYVNKIKNHGLLIIDLDNDIDKLDKYTEKCFDTYTNIDNKIILYPIVDKKQKEFFKYESKKYKKEELYKNIFDLAKYLIGKIEYIVDNIDHHDIIHCIDSIILNFNEIEQLFVKFNRYLDNINLKYKTNEVKNSLIDLMLEIKNNGEFIEQFKKDVIDNSIVWIDLIEDEFC